MKKVFFTLALMLIGTFAFANNSEFVNNSEFETANDNLIVLNTTSEVSFELEESMACFDFTLSCGVSGTACGGDVGELIDVILFVDDLIC